MNDMVADMGPAGRDHDTSACMSLWAAVMRTGIQDAAASYYATGHFDTRVGRWFMGTYRTETQAPGGFEWLCELFSMDPDNARSRARMNFRTIVKSKDVRRLNAELENANRTAMEEDLPKS